MTRTSIDLDDELLAEAARILGTDTATATVNAAMRQVLHVRAQVRAFVSDMRNRPAEGTGEEHGRIV